MSKHRKIPALAALLALLVACDFNVKFVGQDGGVNPLIEDAGTPPNGGPIEPDAGCTPRTCDQLNCGQVADGCGGTISCGCNLGEGCGAAGIPNQCGVPLCQNLKKDRDESDVDCGGQCAPCAAGKHCAIQADCRAGTSCDQTYCLPGVWESKASMPTSRLEPAAVVAPNGRIWVLGGFTNGTGATSVVEVYDPQTDSWTSAPPMLLARYRHTAIIGKDSRLYVFGGQYDDSKSPFMDGISKTAEVYDFTTKKWTALPDLPDGRMGASSAVLADGNIMLVGGLSVNPITTLATPVVFSPSLNTWSPAPSPLLTARAHHAAVQLEDGRIWVAGGNVSGGRTASVEFYDDSVGGWTSLPPLPLANSNMSASRGPHGYVFVFGGNAGNGNLNLTFVFDTVRRQWGSAASMPSERRGTAAVTTSDGKIWVLGGAESPNFAEYASDKVEVLTP